MSERWTETARKLVDDTRHEDWHDTDGPLPDYWRDSELITEIVQVLAAAYALGQQDMQRRAVEVCNAIAAPLYDHAKGPYEKTAKAIAALTIETAP